MHLKQRTIYRYAFVRISVNITVMAFASSTLWRFAGSLHLLPAVLDYRLMDFHSGLRVSETGCVCACRSEQALACSTLGKLWAEQIAGSVFLAAGTLVCVSHVCAPWALQYAFWCTLRCSLCEMWSVLTVWWVFVCARQKTKKRKQNVLRESRASFPQARQGDDTSAIPTPLPSRRFLLSWPRLLQRQTSLCVCTQRRGHAFSDLQSSLDFSQLEGERDCPWISSSRILALWGLRVWFTAHL